MNKEWHPPMACDAQPEQFYQDIITEEQFKKIAFRAPKNAASVFVPHINAWYKFYEIDTPEKMAAFMAQLVHESGHFIYSKELWGPTRQQKRYERDFHQPWHNKLTRHDRNNVAYDLGNSQAGDGKYFMGRGAIQTTGRTNYKKVSQHLFGDDRLLKHPELLETPEYSIRSAMYYFNTRVMPKAKDITDVELVTKLVNGGDIGLEERKSLHEKAKIVFA